MSDASEEEAAPPPGVSWARLLRLAKPQVRRLAAGTVALLLSSGLNLVYPLLVRDLVDGIGAGGGRDAVDRTALLLLGLFAISGLFAAVRYYLFTVAGEQVVATLRQRLYGAIVRQDIAFFDTRRTGELTNRLASDTTVLQNTVTVNLSMLLRHAVTGAGAIAILLYMSWQLTLVMLAIVPVVVIGMRLYGRVLRKLSREVQDALAGATEVAEETFSGIRTVRAFSREPEEIVRYGGAVDTAFGLARTRARLGAIFMGVFSFGGFAAIAVVLWYGGTLLVEGRMTMGELTSFLLYTFAVAVSIGALSGLWEDFMKALGASERIFELLDRAPGVSSGTLRPADVEGAIRFEKVSFRYPSRPDAPVLRGLDLELLPGRVVALVGPSGAGKSTVAGLLSRLYDPPEGRILLDGRDFRTLAPDWLRERVGTVSQEPILFATTIRENIGYGRPGASTAEIEAAARAANAHDFIGAFPEGYETLVGERGVRLSGGQKQRVAIARAVLKDPRVLVLDEATSALDAESEHLVQEALKRLMKGRATLVIAHRLSTVKEADQVVVLDDGRAVQQGSHRELVERDGLYQKLVQRQFAA